MTHETEGPFTLIANERENYNNTLKMLETQRAHTLREVLTWFEHRLWPAVGVESLQSVGRVLRGAMRELGIEPEETLK